MNLEGARWEVIELWCAIITGFHFALRISELEQLEDRDVSFETVDGVTCVTIIIRASKTDQRKLGVRRTLASTQCDLCPVHQMEDWID